MIERSLSCSASSSRKRPARPRQENVGGQRQVVAIARTRLSNAKLALMDEPTAAISVRQVAVLGLSAA
jgi:simple sugar transport system ATP-binding protein